MKCENTNNSIGACLRNENTTTHLLKNASLHGG